MSYSLRAFIKESTIYGLTSVLSRVSAFLLLPLYARFLGKTDYANLMLLLGVFSCITIVFSLYEGVLYYYYNLRKPQLQARVLSSWFYYQLFLSLVVLLCSVLMENNLLELFIDARKEESNALWWTLLGLLPYTSSFTTQ